MSKEHQAKYPEKRTYASRKAEREARKAKTPIDPVLKAEMNARLKEPVGDGVNMTEKDIRTMPDLLALQKTRKRSKRGRPPVHSGKIDGKTWSYKKRVEVLTTYLTTGVYTTTGEITGVPSETIRKWAKEPWWNQLADEIRKQKEHEIDAKLTGIIDKTLEHLVDRLDNGEVIYNPRTGEQIRVPMKSIDTMRVFDKVHEKRALVRGDPTQRVERVTTEQRLNSLADQFTRFGKGNVEIEDADYEVVASDSASADVEYEEITHEEEMQEEEQETSKEVIDGVSETNGRTD